MTDFSSEHDRPVSPGAEPDDTAEGPARVDRRTFLRALSGSALTLVAGGLTVTLAACNGAGSGGNTIFTSSSLAFTPVTVTGSSNSSSSSGSFSPASSNSNSNGGSGSGGSSGSGNSGSSGSSTGSDSGTSSSDSGSSTGSTAIGIPSTMARRGFNTRF